MRFLILLTFLLTTVSAWALTIESRYELSPENCTEVVDENTERRYNRCGAATYFLVGTCEEAATEIKKLDPTGTPSCECDNSNCKTALNPHLMQKMQDLLKSPHPHSDLPNCYNTLLHSLGINLGYMESSYDIEILLSTPYCQRREGRPQTGDVIWADGHGYYALTDQLAFNKSNPGQEIPYEVITIDDYFVQQGQDVSCQFISAEEAKKKNCETTSSAYTCNVPDYLKTNSALGTEGKKLIDKLEECGYKNLVLGQDIEEDILELSDSFLAIARNTLQMPKIEDVDPAIRKLFVDAYQETLDQESQGASQSEDILEVYYLFAAPGMDLHLFEEPIQRAILEARSRGFYPKLPAEERIAWSMAFLTHKYYRVLTGNEDF